VPEEGSKFIYYNAKLWYAINSIKYIMKSEYFLIVY
jgi:hypothetical protein